MTTFTLLFSFSFIYFLVYTERRNSKWHCFRCPMRGHDLDVPVPERPEGCGLHWYNLKFTPHFLEYFYINLIVIYTYSERWVFFMANLSFQVTTLFRWILKMRRATSRQVHCTVYNLEYISTLGGFDIKILLNNLQFQALFYCAV